MTLETLVSLKHNWDPGDWGTEKVRIATPKGTLWKENYLRRDLIIVIEGEEEPKDTEKLNIPK